MKVLSESMNMRLTVVVLFVLLAGHIVQAVILTPPYFNLVANKRVTATATCGEGVDRELYCKLTGSTATDRETQNYANLIQGQYCDICDASNPEKHHHVNYSIDGTDRWWQSPPLSRSIDYNYVNLTIDFGQEFHVAYIYIKMANSPRPGVWALEKSFDYGQTFQPWQYFADTPSDCYNIFATPVTKRIEHDDDVICTTEYSKVLPLEGGEILLSLVNNRPNSKNFTHSDVLQNWTRATNVRLRLMRTKNLLGHLMAVAKQDPTVTRRYYYSIRDISIGGRCVCNGHAEYCEASNPATPEKLICRCSHNTCGDQCETCCDGFVQKKWRQNRENSEFECEPCQCYGHSSNCTYDADVDAKKLSIDIHGNYEGGGVCVDCMHNTMGINCQECKPGYYRNPNAPITSEQACIKCNCDTTYSTGNCAPLVGTCECKPEFKGINCTECSNGSPYWPSCPCDCDVHGRADGSCNAPCNCKFGYLGPSCDRCVDRYYGYPNCQPCDCDREGTMDFNCNSDNGQCLCRPGYTGLRCDECADGYYGDRVCTLCDCDVGTTQEVCNKTDGQCICSYNYAGERCNECARGFYNFPHCLPCNCDQEGSRDTACVLYGNQPQCYCKEGRGGARCDQCAPGFYRYPECLECQCDEAGSVGQSCDPYTGRCNCKANFINDKCSECAPDFFNYPFCEECSCHPDGTEKSFPGCNKDLRMTTGIICPCKEFVTGRKCDKCKDRFFGLDASKEGGCSACECERDGTLNELDVCDQTNGQCQCKLFVDSTGCESCKPGFYSLERNDIFGCESCQCLPGSSVDTECDKTTGQCHCLPHIQGKTCDQVEIGYYLPDLHQLKFEIENGVSSSGKNVRYLFDESTFPKYSWKGYVHLNRLMGEVSQSVEIGKAGTYRMIIRYLNTNLNVTDINVRVSEENTVGDVQRATLYLKPNVEPSFETVTVDQINALILDLEASGYTFSFQNKHDNVFIDYFVLLPSEYYESTVLNKPITEACRDYRDEELCIQYKYPSIDSYSPILVAENSNYPTVDLESIKEFNHTYERPVLAAKLSPRQIINKDNIRLPSASYVLLLDFLNLNQDGQEVEVEVTNTETNQRQQGHVYLYKCNMTTLCREVVLSKDQNEPLLIDGKSTVSVQVKSPTGGEVLLYQLTPVPRDRFDINLIKMSPYCIVNENKQCEPLEYTPFQANKIQLETSDPNSRQDLLRPTSSNNYDYLPSENGIYLFRYYPEATVGIRPQPGLHQQQDEQMLIVHYYQPNHPNVDVTVFLDNRKINGTLQAPYCPSTSGCHGIVKFYPNSETFNMQNVDFQYLTFLLNQNGQDIWLDNVLVASASNVNPTVFDYAPRDLTSQFISKCASSQHFNIDYYSSLFCDQAVLSLSAKYNGGALPCDCDTQGSNTTEICDFFGGQCNCRENIIGRRCERCKTGYFGFPNCKKCECLTGNCDEKTGECVPPVNSRKNETTGEYECEEGYYGFDSIQGCEECECKEDGTEPRGNNICDKKTGQCSCRENMDGKNCDKCQAGYFRYPECLPCSCDLNGTQEDICDASTSECLCKENVEGGRCDYCKQGTFNIEVRNPKGCTQCFCFGQTMYCLMSNLVFVPERSFQDWRLAYAKQNSEQSQISLQTGQVADSSEHPGALQLILPSSDPRVDLPIYWSAPKLFTGNKVTSYGGFIEYKLRIRLPIDPTATSQVRPDIILVGQNMSLIYTSVSQPNHDQVFENKVDLLETKFTHLLTGSSVSREQLMIVLSQLNEIKIKATFYNKLHHSELLDFALTVALDDHERAERGLADVELAKASSAEQCYCPPNFKGYSCESCQDGYYKVKSSGPGLFNCVPCQCNGHADTCDQETGKCIDCRDNTQGDQCEQCKKSHYLYTYPENGHTECRLCPCPGLHSEENVFADSCRYDQNADQVYFCQCYAGYAGDRCDHCAPGHYGDPTRPGGKCLPCECNNNIDLNDYESCDSRTGFCKKCLNNTAGIQCEKCADWHYGDALVLKNCQACDCDHLGTSECTSTGECRCKPNVIGYNCASCKENTWGFHLGEGCKDCDCDPTGSMSLQCDSFSGQCRCKPGVSGLRCDRCEPDFWNFTSVGCQKCECQKDGVRVTETGGYACNPLTGHCQCIEGVMGPKCDQCAERWILRKHKGCEPCDTCVHTLLDDVEELQMRSDEIENGNKNYSLTFKAYNKLTRLEEDFEGVRANVEPSQLESVPLVTIRRNLQQVKEDLASLKSMAGYDINDKMKILNKMQSEADNCNRDISTLRLKMEMLEQLTSDLEREDISTFNTISDEQLTYYENMVDLIVKKDFNTAMNKHQDLLDQFDKANSTVQALKKNFENHNSEIEEIKNKNAHIQKSLAEMKQLIDQAKALEKFRDQDIEFKAYFDNLEQIKNESAQLQASSNEALDTVEKILGQSQVKIDQSSKDLAELTTRVDELSQLYANHDSSFQDLRQKCIQAEQKAQSLAQTGQNWRQRVLQMQSGLAAYEVVQTYENIANKLNEAHRQSTETLRKYQAAEIELEDLNKKADGLKETSERLSQDTSEQLNKRGKLESDYDQLNRLYQDLDRKSRDLGKNLDKVEQWTAKTLTSDDNLYKLQSELEAQQKELDESEEKAKELVRKVQSLDSLRESLPNQQTDELDPTAPKGEQLLKSIESSIESLKTQVPAINSNVKSLMENNDFNVDLEKINKEIYELKMLIESTRQIANDIRVAVNFTDSSVISLKPSNDLHPSMITTSSVYIKTRELFAPIALIYNDSNPNEYVALYLQQGRPHFQYRLWSPVEENSEGSDYDGKSANILSADQPINDGEWHKLEIERVGKVARLRVYSEYGQQEKSLVSQDDSVVFNLDPNGAKFILGQFPFDQMPNDLKTVAAYNNQFRGTMDSFKFNGQNLGLWNYVSARNIRGEKDRKFVSSDDQQAQATSQQSSNEKGVYFMDDASFVCKNNSKVKFIGGKVKIDITLKFRTDSPNGLLWIWYTDDRYYLAVYLESGLINVALGVSSDSKFLLFDRTNGYNRPRFDDNKYHTIKVSLSRTKSSSFQYSLNMSAVERVNEEQEVELGQVEHTTNRYFTLKNGKQCAGGILATDRENIYKDAQFNSFTGCYVSIVLNAYNVFETIMLNEELHKIGVKAYNVLPECPTSSDQCEIKKSPQPAYMQFDLKQEARYGVYEETIGISFVTTNPNGVLLYRLQDRSDNVNIILVQLRNGQLVLSVYGSSEASLTVDSNFNDNKLHNVFIVRRESSIEVRVDNQEDAESARADFTPDSSFNQQVSTNNLFVAGVPESYRSPLVTDSEQPFNNFEGCIVQLIYNNQRVDLSQAVARTPESIKMSKCLRSQARSVLLSIPGYKELQNTVLINRYSQIVKQQQQQSSPNKPGMPLIDNSLANEECTLSKSYDTSQLKPVGIRFGLTKRSRLEVNEEFPIKITTFVSFKFRTLQSDGLMFYASDATQDGDFVAVWLQEGLVNYAFDCGSGLMHIKSKRQYSDGRYHTVVIKRDKQMGTLIITDRTNTSIVENIENKSSGELSSLSVVEPFYFGSVPDNERALILGSKIQSSLIQVEPFVGCMSDFNIAYRTLKSNLIERVDLMNCTNNHESGVFFTGQSATSYANLDNFLQIGQPHELSFEIKSRTKSGVVLFIANWNGQNLDLVKSNYAALELVDGELVYKVVIDGQEAVARYMPERARNELCNSSWIRIKLKTTEKGLISLELKGVEATNSFAVDLSKLNSLEGVRNASIYVGAVPDQRLYGGEITHSSEPFVGCVRDLTVKQQQSVSNDGQATLSKILLDLQLGVGVLNYCPLK